jgi:hypothetical protein
VKLVKTFYVHVPGHGDVYSVQADNESDARQQMRDFLSTRSHECQRLPNNTAVWEFTPQARRTIDAARKAMSRDYAAAGQIFDP